MNKIIAKGVAILAILLVACEKEIPYKGEEGQELIVVNALMENDSTMAVFLEHSIFFLDEQYGVDQTITSGAVVTLVNKTTGETQVLSTPTVDNKYEFTLKTNASHNYYVEVNHPSYPKATATMTSAPAVILSDVDTSSFQNVDGETRKKAVLKFKDPVGKNYYFVRVKTYDVTQNSYYDTQILSSDVSFDQENNPFGDNYGYDYINFTDELFEGKNKEFELDFYQIYNSPSNPIKYQYDLICMTEEAYNYHVSIQKSSNAGFFSEPVKIFNNITDGYGIFAGINHSIILE